MGHFGFSGLNPSGSLQPWHLTVHNFDVRTLTDTTDSDAVPNVAHDFVGQWRESFYNSTIIICISDTDVFEAEYTAGGRVTGKLQGKVRTDLDQIMVHGQWEEIPETGRSMHGKFAMILHPGKQRWTGHFQDGTARFLWQGQRNSAPNVEARVESVCQRIFPQGTETTELSGDLASDAPDETGIENEMPLEVFKWKQKIEARWQGGAVYYPGIIHHVHVEEGGERSYDIKYDDGDSEKRVRANLIRSHVVVDMDKSISAAITDSNFEQLVGGAKPVFVNWYTTWCSHCKAFYASWETIARHLKKKGKVGFDDDCPTIHDLLPC